MQFLLKIEFGGCLADDMGLGKTIQTIAMLLSQKKKEIGTSLIVMPTTLIFNWQREIEKFAPSLKYLIHAGPNRSQTTLLFNSVDVILSTYGIIRNDISFLSSYEFSTIVLDESQVIKNP
ncbi:MAG: SNF2-related protein, partial [Bacteroidota bacterium]